MVRRTHHPVHSSPLRPVLSPLPPSPEIQEQQGASFIQSVPDEILLQIFSHASSSKQHRESHIASLMLVCKHWQHLFESILFRDPSFTRSGHSDIDGRIHKLLELLESNTRLRRFVRSFRLKIPNNHETPLILLNVAKILELCQLIRKVSLQYMFYHDDGRLIEAVKNLPLLEHLTLFGSGVGPCISLLSDCFKIPTLERLNVYRHGSKLTKNDPNERLRRTSIFSQSDLQEVLPPQCYHTSNVSSVIFNTPVTPSHVTALLLKLPKRLEYISIGHMNNARHLRPYTIVDVQQFLDLHSQSLNRITLGSMQLTGNGDYAEGGLPNFSHFPLLEKVTISVYNILAVSPSQALEHLQAPNLRTLSLSFSRDHGVTRRDRQFQPQHVSWFQQFAIIKKSNYPTSRLEKIFITKLDPYHGGLDKCNFEMPKQWPWKDVDRACNEVASYCPGLVMDFKKPHYTKLAWDRIVKRAIMKREREDFKSEHDILGRFKRRTIPEGLMGENV